MHGDFTRRLWREISGWIEEGKIKPLAYQVVEGGLSAKAVNEVRDKYRDGKNTGKWHVHPNV